MKAEEKKPNDVLKKNQNLIFGESGGGTKFSRIGKELFFLRDIIRITGVQYISGRKKVLLLLSEGVFLST